MLTRVDGTYKEWIPLLTDYIYESKFVEAELGLRVEYVNLKLFGEPNHNTYKSDGYNYAQPFPNVRFGYKINDQNKLTAFLIAELTNLMKLTYGFFPSMMMLRSLRWETLLSRNSQTC